MNREYKTRDGLGDVYQAIAEGKCVCYFTTADCPQHGIKMSIYSTSTTTSPASTEGNND